MTPLSYQHLLISFEIVPWSPSSYHPLTFWRFLSSFFGGLLGLALGVALITAAVWLATWLVPAGFRLAKRAWHRLVDKRGAKQ